MIETLDESMDRVVWGLFLKEEGTNLQKAIAVHEYIASMTPEEFAKVVDIEEYVPCYAWRSAEQSAYRLMWYYRMG